MPTVTWARVDPRPSRRGGGGRGGRVRRARLLARQPERHRPAGRRRQGQPVPVLRGQARPLRLHRRRRQPAGAVPTWRTASASSTRQTVLRIPHRPARHAGSRTSPSIRGNAHCTRAASFEVDTDARVSVRTVIHRHYLEVLRPLWCATRTSRGDLRADGDTDALLSLLLMIFPHLALAPYVRGMDPDPRARRAYTRAAGTGRARLRRRPGGRIRSCRSTRRQQPHDQRRRPIS